MPTKPPIAPIGHPCMVYLPNFTYTFAIKKSTIHVGKYTVHPMDGIWVTLGYIHKSLSCIPVASWPNGSWNDVCLVSPRSGDTGGTGMWGGDWGIMQPARSISAPFERGYGKLPKERGYGWILVFKVLSANGQRGHGRNRWYLKSQLRGLSGALGGTCNLGNGCQELSGDVGGICDLGSRIQDLSGDRGWNIRPVENKWKSSFYLCGAPITLLQIVPVFIKKA